MSTQPLPDYADLTHLKHQARDLLRQARRAEADALARLREFHPDYDRLVRTGVKLADAQLTIARVYGFPSWPKLKTHLEYQGLVGSLKQAIDTNNIDGVKRLMTSHPELHAAPLGYGKNGPLTWVAECRVPWEAPSETRLAIARWMLENGSDVHQGGDGPLMRAALNDERVPMLDLLVEYGADVNAQWGGFYPIICAPCEALAPRCLRWLLDHGADPTKPSSKYGTPTAILIGTYSRDSDGKHACLDTMADWGLAIPDTPAMAVHRGRIDLLEQHLLADPGLLSRRFSLAEIFPPDVGMTEDSAVHATPLDGVTLLHMAVDFDEDEIVRWLLERGADPNATASVDSEGFGGQTPLFHTVVTLGRKDDSLARALLDAGADPRSRATLRKQLQGMGNPEKERMREFRDVAPVDYARQFAEPDFVNAAAVRALTSRQME
jgi:ankyrin repeat protein